jgi:thioredoxin reductase (NADPH)
MSTSRLPEPPTADAGATPDGTDLPADPGTETADLYGAYPRLSETQLAELESQGTRRAVQPGDVLVRAGDPYCDFMVVLSGKVAVIEGADSSGRVIAVHGPGRFLGEIGMLTGQALLLSAVVQEAGEILAVPIDRLRDVVAADPGLGDLILRACLIRRSLHQVLGAGLRIIGSRHSPDARRLREFAARNRLPHRWVDLEDDRDADRLVEELGITPAELPVVIWRGTQVLRNPSNEELARRIGLQQQPDHLHPACDLVVVGAGPAGLAAAVCAASEGLSTIVLDAVATGGQAGTSSRIENYLGFPAGISGAELTDRAVIQAKKFGAVLTVPARASALDLDSGQHLLSLESGEPLRARSVLIATGAQYRRLDVPGMDRLEPVAVYYAATEIEANQCRSDPVVVVGGGNSAGQATVFLSEHASRVVLVVRNDHLDTDMSRYLADRIVGLPRVDVKLHSEVAELKGDEALDAVVVQDLHSGQRELVPARSLFVFIGSAPGTQWLPEDVAVDEHGFVLTGDAAEAAHPRTVDDPGAGRSVLLLETTRRGVFAGGDVRSGSVKRVAAAVGDGALAVRLVHEHLAAVGRSPTTSSAVSASPTR